MSRHTDKPGIEEMSADAVIAALSESEERLRLALKAGGLGSWQLDLATFALESSDICKANYGLPPDAELTYSTLLAMIHPEDRAKAREAVERAIAGRADFEADYRVVRPDGAIRWMAARGRPFYDPDGTPLRMIGTTQDTTDRKRAEEERERLLRAEQSARQTAERVADRMARLVAVTTALAEATTREEVAAAALREGIAAVGAVAGGLGTLTDNGERVERLAMFGYPEEILDATRLAPLDDLGPVATTARTGEAVWLETNEEIFSRYPQLAAIPARRHYGAAVSAPLTAGGRVIGVMSLRFGQERPFDADDRDLVMAIAGQCAQALERARLFEDERVARAEAEAAVRSRDEFLSIASHELKTPIAALKGSAQLLLRRYERNDLSVEQLARSLRTMNDAANRLTSLTNDLLDVSRLRTGQLVMERAPVSLVNLAYDAVARVVERYDRNDQIGVDVPETIPLILADTARIEQVLDNLLDNAIKYSPDGGEITVAVRHENDGVTVSVRDSGIGLPSGAEEAIFEPFGRAANAARSSLPGMGLGLHICRNIVERHGGRIWAESPGEDRGASFHVWLPSAQSPDEDAEDA